MTKNEEIAAMTSEGNNLELPDVFIYSEETKGNVPMKGTVRTNQLGRTVDDQVDPVEIN
jgi:hypothetical protein